MEERCRRLRAATLFHKVRIDEAAAEPVNRADQGAAACGEQRPSIGYE